MAKENHIRKENKSSSTNGLLSLLKGLDHHQLLEVLSEGFCQHCEAHLKSSARSFIQKKVHCDKAKACEGASSSSEKSDKTDPKKSSSQDSTQTPEILTDSLTKKSKPNGSSLPSSMNNNTNHRSSQQLGFGQVTEDGGREDSSLVLDSLSEEEERIRASRMGWKNNFDCLEKIDGRVQNVLQGLELYTRVFSFEEQRKIVEYVDDLQDKGRKKQLIGRTYSEPRKWMPGKGRVTIQFGCCYNYATDKEGNPPGIVRNAEVEPLPPLFKQMIKRLVRWRILPAACVPDSCVVNIYEKGDCIPPHIDHHDFARPFCTVSLLSECKILFDSNLQIVGAGEFRGDSSINLPLGSVLVFNGNGANLAEHCISSVSTKRISITFRKMDNRKRPYNFQPDSEMQRIKPLATFLNYQARKYQSNKFTVNKYSKKIRKNNSIREYYKEQEDDSRPVRRKNNSVRGYYKGQEDDSRSVRRARKFY